MTRTFRLVPLLLGLVVTACAPASTTTPPAAVAAAPLDALCAGVPACKRVATVDVDGDSRVDQVGVAGVKLADGGQIVVRVRTATGQTLQTTGRRVHWFAKPFFGAAPLDGRRGAEIVVGDTMGAHYQQFRVITYRAGKLVTLKAPPLVWSKDGANRPTSRWAVDGSYRFNTGVTRSVSADRSVMLTMRTLERRDSGRGHVGQATHYRWSGGRWVKVSAQSLRVSSDKRAYAVGGWHVPGLRRFV